mmetsp:Transcript_19139/g.45310  ORF Transcript_19139/g.45310 Transcript_19139/m.45310 type:complete len:219 (+) Transcript_19139:152-808(+)
MRRAFSLICAGAAITPALGFHVVPHVSAPVARTSQSFLAGASGGDDFIPLSPEKRPPPQGGDMAYVRDNITRQMDNYLQIRKVGWPSEDCINDCYVRNPRLSTFWFVGKVAKTHDVSLQQAVARQWNLIEEHATRLRPIELGRSFGSCEVWVAPGDTEFQVAENDPNIRLERMERSVDDCDSVKTFEVGLNLEVVTNRGAGFFVVRNEDGIVPPELLQ